MTAAQQGDQGLLDNLVLTKDDFADAGTHKTEAAAERIHLGDDIGGCGVDGCRRRQELTILFQALRQMRT